MLNYQRVCWLWLQDLDNDLENRKLSQYHQNPSLFVLAILLLLHIYVLDAHRYTTCKSPYHISIYQHQDPP
jgi:hypothetical protein